MPREPVERALQLALFPGHVRIQKGLIAAYKVTAYGRQHRQCSAMQRHAPARFKHEGSMDGPQIAARAHLHAGPLFLTQTRAFGED